jgi:hypothetical protein
MAVKKSCHLLTLHVAFFEQPYTYTGFEVFMAVTMKNVVLWDVAPLELIINQRFGGTCRFHLQGGRNNVSEENARR